MREQLLIPLRRGTTSRKSKSGGCSYVYVTGDAPFHISLTRTSPSSSNFTGCSEPDVTQLQCPESEMWVMFICSTGICFASWATPCGVNGFRILFSELASVEEYHHSQKQRMRFTVDKNHRFRRGLQIHDEPGIYFDGELIRKDGLFVPDDLLPLNPENLM